VRRLGGRCSQGNSTAQPPNRPTASSDWFNAVDATYRADLRELNELNFQRFDAKVEQRFAQADAKVEQRFSQFEVKLESRLTEVERQLAELRSDLRTEFHTALADQRASLVKWAFVFWIPTFLAVLGLYMR